MHVHRHTHTHGAARIFNTAFSTSPLYSLSATARLPVCLPVSLFKHLASIISIYFSFIIMYELPTMLTEGLTLCACVRERATEQQGVCMRVCACACPSLQILVHDATNSLLLSWFHVFAF